MSDSDSESEISTVYMSEVDELKKLQEEKQKRLDAAFESRSNVPLKINTAVRTLDVNVDLTNFIPTQSRSLFTGGVRDKTSFCQDFLSNDLLSDVLASAAKHFEVPVEDFEIENRTLFGDKAEPHMTIDRVSGEFTADVRLKYTGLVARFEWKDTRYRVPLGKECTKEDFLAIADKRFGLADQGLQIVMSEFADKVTTFQLVQALSEKTVQDYLTKGWSFDILRTTDMTEALESKLAYMTIMPV